MAHTLASSAVIHKATNIDKINKLVDQAKKLNVEKINLTLVQPFGRALENQDLILKPEEYMQVLPKISKLKNVHFESLLCFSKELSNDSKTIKRLSLFNKYISGCAAGKKFIYINPEGYVTPCGYITADKKLLEQSGNIFEMSLREIYKTPLFQFFMNRSWESVSGKCTSCNYSVVCKGGCPFRTFYLKNSLNLPDPWCFNNPEENKYIDVGVNIKNFQKEEYLVQGV